MDRYYSTADILREYENSGWKRRTSKYGYVLSLPRELGEGSIEVCGDPESHCFIISDIVLCRDLLERYCYKEKGIQIGFIEDMTPGACAEEDAEAEDMPNTFFSVNNVSRVWFERFPAGCAQRVYTLVIMEKFIQSFGSGLPDVFWDHAARTFNGKEIYSPEAADICRQLRDATMDEDAFPLFLHAKAVEALCFMVNYVKGQKEKKLPGCTRRSKEAAERVAKVLDQSYARPPVIEALARAENIDKKTLQCAFRNLTGQTIGEYVQSLRMKQALILLEETDMCMERIAKEIGYSSKCNFYNAFQKTYGYVPGKMRRMLLKNKEMR